MVRIVRRVAALAVVVAILAVAGVAPAHADVDDGLAAQITNTLDQTAAVNVPDPNITCDVSAGGRDLVQHTNYIVGEVYAQDFGEASGECVSLDRVRKYTVSLSVRLEYFTRTGLTTGYWSAIPVCPTGGSSAESIQGVGAPLPALTTCTYPGTSAYLNRYHRARADLVARAGTTTLATRRAYSPIWFMAP